MKISAIVCTYNRDDLIGRAIASLAAQELPATDYEIVVVDNGSTDGTAAAVAALQRGLPHLRYVREPVLGLSNARNRGLKEACGRIVSFLDDDAEAEPGWLRGLLDAFAAEPVRPLVVGGRVDPNWERPPPRWLPPYALGSLSIVDYGAEARALSFPEEWLAGCNIAFERDYLLGVGGFDPRLGRRGASLMSNEETALLTGVIEAGGRVRYDPAARVRHLVPAARLTLRWFCRRLFAQGVSDVVAGNAQGASTHAGRAGRQALRLLNARRLDDVYPTLIGLSYDVGVAVQSVKQRFRRR